MDLSPLRKWEILGPGAEALMQHAVTRDIRRLADGQVVYTAMCNETGGMVDDATVFRLGADNFRFVGGDEYDGVHLRQIAEREDMRVWIKPTTDQLHNLAVQGPLSRDILKEIIWSAPAQPQLEELGLDALEMLRIESGLIFAGYEFDDQVDPFEAGISFTVVLDTENDFVGKEALIARKERPQRTLVGLELEGNETAGHGDCVHVPGARSQVGVITSGTRSPTLRKNIALCRMAIQYAEQGTQVEVGKLDGHQKRIPATVVRVPFYDPEKKRPRM